MSDASRPPDPGLPAGPARGEMAPSRPHARALALVLDGLYLLAALAVLALSAAGRFLSIDGFPWIFGICWAAVGILSLLVFLLGKEPVSRLRVTFLALGTAAALAAPVVHWQVREGRASALEEAALEHLQGRPAPPLAHDWVIHDGGEGPRPASPASGLLQGRVTVVSFWATWCPPCIEELPMLSAFARRHDSGRLRLVGFTRLYQTAENEPPAEELAEVAAFLQQHGAAYPSLVARDGATHQAYRVSSLPSTVLLAPDGQVVAFGVGLEGTRDVLRQAEELLP